MFGVLSQDSEAFVNQHNDQLYQLEQIGDFLMT